MPYRPRGLRRAATAAFLFLLSIGLPARAAEHIELVSRALPGLVSDTGGSASSLPFSASGMVRRTLSADGRYLVFTSSAPNLLPGQVENNVGTDVFLHDRVEDTLTLVSHTPGNPLATGNNASTDPSISADGRYVAFTSTSIASMLTAAADFNNAEDVFLFDRATGAITLVSHVAGAADSAGGNASFNPMISADGNWIVFQSRAANLVAGQANDFTNNDDVFLWERAANASTLVSHAATSPSTDANNVSSVPVISDDGAWVAYLTFATNLVNEVTDTNFNNDVYLWERATNGNRLVSHTSDSATTAHNTSAQPPRLSADGSRVVFLSTGTNLVNFQSDTNSALDAFLYSRDTGELTLISHNAAGPNLAAGGVIEPALSADGNWVAFGSTSGGLVTGQNDNNNTYDVFLWSRATNTSLLVSRQVGTTTTAAATVTNFGPTPEVTADGSKVAFLSRATGLVTGYTDPNVQADLFLFDRASGTNTLVSGSGGSATAASDNQSKTPVFSANGQWLAFGSTSSDLISGVNDNNSTDDVFLREVSTGTNTLVSRRDAGSPSDTAGGTSIVPFITTTVFVPSATLSANGRYVAFQSTTERLVPGQVKRTLGYDVYFYDRWTGTTTLVSRAHGTTADTGNGVSQNPVISADGRWVAYSSRATNLFSGQIDTANTDDLFLWDSQTGTTTLVSHTATSLVTAAGGSSLPQLAADGSAVAFLSTATNLMSGQLDSGTSVDVFHFDRASGLITLVSHRDINLVNAAGGSSEPSISADGQTVAFLTNSSFVVPGQTDANGAPDVFLWARATGTITLVSHTAASATTATGASWPALSADGNWIAFGSTSNAMVTGQTDTNSQNDVFLWERATNSHRLVSHTPASATTAGSLFSQGVALSANGSRVAFLSRSVNLVTGQSDTNNAHDVFVYDRATGQVSLASHTPAGAVITGNGAAIRVGISADGSRVSFLTAATNLVTGQTDTAATNDLFLYETATGSVRLLSRRRTSPSAAATNAEAGALSGDGQVVLFTSSDSALVANDYNGRSDVFLWLADTLANVGITKTDGVASAIPGQGVTYTITATNAGPYPTTATVTDSFPAALQGISWTCAPSSGATCTGSGVGNLVDTVSLPVNGTVTYTVSATVAADATGTLDNTATVAIPAGVADPVPGNNSATDSDTLTPRANLAVTLSDSPDPVGRGAALTYSIEVANAGPSTAGTVSVVQTLPAGVAFTSATGDGWSCGEAAETVTCTRPSLATGSAPALTVLVTAPASRGIATLSSGVTVSSAAEDVDNNDNTATAETSVPQPGITVTPASGLTTTEAGGTGTFTVVLDTAPLADVTIALTSSDTGEGTVDPASLTFTTGNWSTPQTVTVTGVDDAYMDGDASYTVETGAASSTDAGYAGIDPADVTATNEDDDTAGIQVTPTADLVTTEAGGADTFTVVLTSRPSQDVTIALESSDASEGQPSPGFLTFTSEDWDTPQTVTVTGQDDDLTDGDVAYTIVLQAAQSSDPAFNGLDPNDVAATNQDDASEGTYFTVASCRLLDTRRPEDGPALANGEIGMLAVHGGCGVPSTARAVAVNVTTVGGDDVGHLLIYPGDLAEAPVLTFLPVRVRRNTALFTVMPLAADGSGTLALEPRLAPTEMNPIPTVHVIVDVLGYFE